MTSPVPMPPTVGRPPEVISDPVDRIQPRPVPPVVMPPGPQAPLPAEDPGQPPMLDLGVGGPAPVEQPGQMQSQNRLALARLMMQGRMRGRGQRF